MFEVADYDAATNNFTFGAGGNQGARGSDEGGDWFIENVIEELDYPNEFFFDKKQGLLYLNYNGTGAPPTDLTVVPLNSRSWLTTAGPSGTLCRT